MKKITQYFIFISPTIIIYAIIFIGIIIGVKFGFIAFLNFFKDFLVNLVIGITMVYIFINENKIKALRASVEVEGNRVRDYAKLVDAIGGIDVQELIRQEKQFAQNQQELSKKESRYHTQLQILTIVTILAILLAIVAYFYDLLSK